MYEIILFDLDGTLTDPGIGITNSVAYALKKMGIVPPERYELYKFIGPPLAESFSKYYSLSESDCEKAITEYRVYFKDKGIFENTVYFGVHNMLESLKNNGKKIILATSKPEEFAIRILKHFSLFEYFDSVFGASMDGKISQKGDVIKYALEKADIKDSSKCVMIGDRKYDIIGAKMNNIDSIGVLYGYGNFDELTNAGATYIAEKVEDILTLI